MVGSRRRLKRSGCWVDRAGAYDEEEAAARAYDLAALKYWGPGTVINFKVHLIWTLDRDRGGCGLVDPH